MLELPNICIPHLLFPWQNIWKMTDDNDSSLTSFQSIDDAYENIKYANYGRREASLDR